MLRFFCDFVDEIKYSVALAVLDYASLHNYRAHCYKMLQKRPCTALQVKQYLRSWRVAESYLESVNYDMFRVWSLQRRIPKKTEEWIIKEVASSHYSSSWPILPRLPRLALFVNVGVYGWEDWEHLFSFVLATKFDTQVDTQVSMNNYTPSTTNVHQTRETIQVNFPLCHVERDWVSLERER